jgi:hypothetical protein
MRVHIFRVLAATALAWGLSLAGLPALAQAGAPPLAQSSAARGVTVKVVARNVAAGVPTWELGVTLDTHSQDLPDDLLQTTVLVTEDGRELRPAAWKGAGPGGHHREGTLEFAAPDPAPRSFELRMRRPGESEPRVFRFGP